jgi:hypothetical protein
MTIILVAVSLTVYFSFYMKAYTPASKQWNPASFSYACVSTARYGYGSMGMLSLVPVTSPLHLEMSDASTLFKYHLGINLTSSNKIQFKFLATAPIDFYFSLENGRSIVRRIQATSFESEFHVEDSGSYVFDFEPVHSNPDATVIFDARLDC